MTGDLARLTAARAGLAAALAEVLDALGPPVEIRPGSGIYAGANLADELSAALSIVAADRGGAEMLVAHRPGCWEADHVRALVMEL